MKALIILLFTFASLSAQEYKITFEVKWDNQKEQMMAMHNSTENNLQQGIFIDSGWRHIYRTTDTENPLMIKVGTIKPNKKEKITVNLYINDKLVETKTEKVGWFMDKPLTLMTYISDIKDKL